VVSALGFVVSAPGFAASTLGFADSAVGFAALYCFLHFFGGWEAAEFCLRRSFRLAAIRRRSG